MKTKFTKLTIVGSLVILTIIGLLGFTGKSEDAKSISKVERDTAHVFVKKDLKIEKFYSKKELEDMPKLSLIRIYKERLAYLIEVLPFISLHPKPGASFYDMAIPETKDNIAHLEKETENKQAFIESLFETLDDVIPYSEKDHIIWSILYFDEMIQKSDYK